MSRLRVIQGGIAKPILDNQRVKVKTNDAFPLAYRMSCKHNGQWYVVWENLIGPPQLLGNLDSFTVDVVGSITSVQQTLAFIDLNDPLLYEPALDSFTVAVTGSITNVVAIQEIPGLINLTDPLAYQQPVDAFTVAVTGSMTSVSTMIAYIDLNNPSNYEQPVDSFTVAVTGSITSLTSYVPNTWPAVSPWTGQTYEHSVSGVNEQYATVILRFADDGTFKVYYDNDTTTPVYDQSIIPPTAVASYFKISATLSSGSALSVNDINGLTQWAGNKYVVLEAFRVAEIDGVGTTSEQSTVSLLLVDEKGVTQYSGTLILSAIATISS